MQRKFGVGQRVWRRSKLRWSEYEEHEVTAMTGRSYLVAPVRRGRIGHPQKISFQKAEQSFRTEAEYADDRYIDQHRHKIASLVTNMKDAATLRRVAAVVGYQDAEEGVQLNAHTDR